MDIIISNHSDEPIYAQIENQIKALIMQSKLKAGDALPSMRSLAKDLRISLITTKRAYEELERDGFIVTVAGKGCFVAAKNTQFVREENLKEIEKLLTKAVEIAAMCDISQNELAEILSYIYEEK
ncbi:MAG: GntR family transcriptional regulator [Oscillospiraceae bacterium]|nr:GntR family transcriptional regulator [Oscillospiraceae bacterium]